LNSSIYTVETECIEKDPRFKTILNDVLKFDPSESGKIVNFKFRPDHEKPNFYVRKYSPEKEGIANNIKQYMKLYLPREPYHKDGVSLRNR